MYALPYALFALFGAIVGSFLNVVLYRLHTGKTVGGRSHCMSCGETLVWYELIPVMSYLMLRGRCNICSSYIPVRYLFVEVLTAVLFMLGWHTFSSQSALLVLSLVLFSFLVLILVYDIRHTIIPNELTIGVGMVAVAVLGYQYATTHTLGTLVAHIVAGLLSSGFFWALWYFSQGRWMGFGDVKLALPLGALVGGWSAFSMIVFSFWVGAVVTLLMVGIQNVSKQWTNRMPFLHTPLTMKSEVPFAPFLLTGFLLTYIFHVDIFSIITHVFL